MRSAHVALAGAVCALVAASRVASAHELILGAKTSGGYDSNVFSTEEDVEDDVLLRVGPILRLRHPAGDLTYDLNYEPTYDFYRAFNELNDWEHALTGRLTWQIGPRTRLELSDQFYLTNTARRAQQLQAVDPALAVAPVPEAVRGTERFLTNSAALTGSHLLTPRFSIQATLASTIYRPERDDLVDTTSTTATSTLLYALTERQRLGGGGGVTWQQYSGTNPLGDSETYYYQVYGRWEYDVSPTWKISLQAGPAYVDPKVADSPTQALVNRYPLFRTAGDDRIAGTGDDETFLLDFTTCERRGDVIVDSGCAVIPARPTTPPGDDSIESVSPGFAAALRNSFFQFPLQDVQEAGESSVTYFADASITKSWETVDALLTFRRSAGSAAGLGTGTTDSTLRGAIIWRPDRNWRLTFSSFYSLRESVGEQPENRAIVGDIASGPAGPFEETITVLGIFYNPQFFNAARSIGARQFTIDNATELSTFSLGLYTERRFSKNFVAFGRAFYTYHVSKFESDAFDSRVSYDSTRFDLGIRYEFDPIRLF